MKNPWVIVGVIAIILFGGAIWYSNSVSSSSNEGVDVTAHITGNPDAPVKLIEYSDFQCPACAAFNPVVKQALEMYGESISFEYRHFPLPIHNYASQAGVSAEAAGQQGKFFEYGDLLFTNQNQWSNAQTPNSFFLSYAEELRLDMDTFKQHQRSTLLRDAVRDGYNEARDMGLSGTPTFVLNGEIMEFSTYQEFLDQIGEAVSDPAGFEIDDTLSE